VPAPFACWMTRVKNWRTERFRFQLRCSSCATVPMFKLRQHMSNTPFWLGLHTKTEATQLLSYYYYYYYHHHHHHHFLSQVFSLHWYFSWASGEPHHSGFKSQTVALSLWCVMFLVWQFFVGNLLSVVLVLFPDIFVNFCLQFRWPVCRLYPLFP
jgi:hypothetical protein